MSFFEKSPSSLMGIYRETRDSDLGNLFDGPLPPLTDSSEDEADTHRPVTDLEDGEIQEPRTESKVGFTTSVLKMTKLRLCTKIKKAQSRNRRRMLKAKGRADLDAQILKEKNQYIQDVRHSLRLCAHFNQHLLKVLQKIYGDEHVFVHRVFKNPDYFKTICDIESATNSPLSANDPAFPKEKTQWIYEPGLHLGLDSENAVIFAIRIRSAIFTVMTMTIDHRAHMCAGHLQL